MIDVCLLGIHPSDAIDNQMFDVCFDQPFPGGLALRSSKGAKFCRARKKSGSNSFVLIGCSYRVPASAIINLSHGLRVSRNKNIQGVGGKNLVQPNASNGSSFRQQSPKKPTAVVTPLDLSQPPPQAVPSNICPPDPKNLPNPMMLFNRGNKQKDGGANMNKKTAGPPSAPKGDSQDMMNLWSSLEKSTAQSTAQTTAQPTAQAPPRAAAHPFEEAMSSNLKVRKSIVWHD
jgi:hypothetical protein